MASLFPRAWTLLLVLLVSFAPLLAGPVAVQAATRVVTTTADSGPGSLREAISAAASGDLITFAPSLQGQAITLVSGPLEVTQNLTIRGPGAKLLQVSGGGNSTVFIIGAATVQLEGLTISDGFEGDEGGGILNNGGTLGVVASVIRNNLAGMEGGGVYNNGGSVSIVDTIIADNEASVNGGGIYSRNGSLTLTGSTVSGNWVLVDDGGGIYSRGGTLAITNSTITGNSTWYYGGGVYNGYNSTATIVHSTLAGNSARNEDITGFVQGANIFTFGQTTITNSIVAAGLGDPSCGAGDQGAFTASNTINPDGSCGQVIAADPLLDPAGLRDNGGPTPTIALQAGSPALDAVACIVATDQRGVLRPQGVACDIGAVEMALPSFPTTTVLDSFTKKDGRLTADWRGERGPQQYLVRNNQVDVVRGGFLAWRKTGPFGADQEAFLTLTTIDTASRRHTLLLKGYGSKAQHRSILVSYDAPGQQVLVEAIANNRVYLLVASIPVALSNGDQLGAQALADGSVRVFVNGSLVGTADTRTVAGDRYVNLGGEIGFYFKQASNATFDDFGGGDIR